MRRVQVPTNCLLSLVMAAHFLRELPCRDRSNFAQYQADAAGKASHKKAAVYLPTSDQADSPEQQGQ